MVVRVLKRPRSPKRLATVCSKMNIDTDTQFAFSAPVGKFVNENPKAFLYQVDPEDGTPFKKFYDPRKYLRAGEQGIVDRLLEACDDLGSKGRSIASA